MCEKIRRSNLLAAGGRWLARPLIEAVFPLLFIVFLGILPCTQGSCQFPLSWTGSWFQSGFSRPVVINRTSISSMGFCLQESADKFFIEDRKEKLFRCVVIHQKDANGNVLQYKEAFSERRESLETLCQSISGDAPLYSMFKVGASPIPCPLKGPFQFSYFRGDNRECRNPVSSVDLCTEDWRLLFRFQACPDVMGSESTEEELVCLGTWKEGSVRYLVAKLEHKMVSGDEDKYRCFVFEKHKEHEQSTFQLAQSGDATCNGLATIEGSRTLRLTKGNHPLSRCHYPSWATHAHHWHTLDWKHVYNFSHRNNSFRVTNTTSGLETRVVCSEDAPNFLNTPDVATYITHVTTGCKIGYVCMVFYRRAQHVVELQSGNFTNNREEACLPQFFNRNNTPFVTLTTNTPQVRQCPYLGRYNVVKNFLREKRSSSGTSSCNEGFSSLRVGCSSIDTLEFESECQSEKRVEAYECHANWEENGTNFLITSMKGTRTRYCFVYSENDKVLQFSSVQDSCHRSILPGVSGVVAFNVTSNGQCGDVTSDFSPRSAVASWAAICLAVAASLMITRMVES